MKHFKYIEIARKYEISLPTVMRWIDESLQGKKSLEIIEYKGKRYIAKTPSNESLLESYVSKGMKYKPTNSRVVVKPKDEFVKYLTDKQLIEIKKDLVERQCIDLKFGYIDGGADIWESMYNHSQGGVLRDNEPYPKMNSMSIERIMEIIGNKKVNVIDIGAGNGVPLLFVLKQLKKQNMLNSYTAIDISTEMNKIAERNILNEIPDLQLRSYTRDVEFDSFEEIIYEMHQEDPEAVNIVFLFGGTLGNFSYPERMLMNIERSMLPDDILYINNPYPNPSRFNDAKYMYESPTVDHYLYAAKALGLEVGVEDIEFEFDKETLSRQLFVSLPKQHAFTLRINDKDEIIELPKGYRIKIFQIRMMDLAYLQKITAQFQFELILYSIARNNKVMVTVFRKKGNIIITD